MEQSREDFRTALITKINDGFISFQNHTFDNSFLDVDVDEMYRKMVENECRAVGISFNCPYPKYGKDDVVFAFKDDENELKWIHLTRGSWEHYVLQLKKIYGKNNIENIMKQNKIILNS